MAGCGWLRLAAAGGGVGTMGRMSSCVFCQLLTNAHPVTWVAREEAAVAFLPLPNSALAPGHTLVAPTAHAVGVQDAATDSLTSTMALVQRVSIAMRTALGATGVNVLNASGPGSEQSVPHLHFHVVPRWEGDGFTTWPRERSTQALSGDPATALAQALAPSTCTGSGTTAAVTPDSWRMRSADPGI